MKNTERDPCRPAKSRTRQVDTETSDTMPVMVLTVPASGCCNLDLLVNAKIADLKELIALKLDIDES
jgi:hypothetical protein